MPQVLSALINFIFFVPFLIMSVVVHEYAHGRAAELLGDPTARHRGRLTLNPLAHLDIFGSLLLPLLIFFASGFRFTFGYAKPVPINPEYFENPERGMMITGAAGPLSNLILAAGASFLLRVGLVPQLNFFLQIALLFVMLNVVLAVFNLIPIPPLDGSRILAGVLPKSFLPSYYQLERYGMIVLIILIFFFSGLFWQFMSFFVDPLMRFLVGPGFLNF